MDVDFSPLYNPAFIQAFRLATELTEKVALLLEENEIKIRWNNISKENGLYFCIKNPADNREEITFGIWNDLWFETNSPLSISINCFSITPFDLKRNLEEFLSFNRIAGTTVLEFQGWVNIIFTEEFFLNTRYAREIMDLILAIANQCNFLLDYKPSPW